MSTVYFDLDYNSIFLQDGWTPLFDASKQNHTDVMELLINHGAKLDIKNKVTLYIPHTSHHGLYYVC